MKIFANKAVMTFMVIVGTVIGSGFLSGKEIVVFFSRFGNMSYFCIFIAFFLFFALFYYFLKFGDIIVDKLSKSKFSNILNCFICFTLSSAMFAGIFSLVEDMHFVIKLATMLIVFVYACRVAIKGASLLERLNLILVPIMIIFLLINLIRLFSVKSGSLFLGGFYPFSLFFCILYVVLNTSNSAIVISSFGKDLSNKQKVQVSFFSALALCLILLFANIVLLQNSFVFGEDMPILELFVGPQKFVMSLIILLGCVTTLFSLVYSNTGSLRGVCNNNIFVLFIGVVMPFALSFMGFGFIVSKFYPLTSVLGIFLLCDLLLFPLFKKVYKKIHSASKNRQ